MKNSYELVLIFTPVLSEDEVKTVIKGYRQLLTDAGVEVVHEDFWGLKTLAYPIRKKTTGMYFVMEFKAPADLIVKMELQFKRDEQILRFLTVRLDKYSLEYNEKRRQGLIGRKKEKVEEAPPKETNRGRGRDNRSSRGRRR